MIIETIVKIFVEGILLRFWKFVGNTLNRIDDFVFKRKK